MAVWTSEVAVCNGALGLLGAERIVSLDDGTTQAALCDLHYAQARDATMRAFSWNFAIARANLGAPLSSGDARAPLFDWSYAFMLPRTSQNFCLRVLTLEDNDDYKVEGPVLMCNSSTARIKYIKRVEAVSEWDDLFKGAVAAHLAMLLAMPITKSASMMQAMAGLYQSRLQEAYAVDTQEGTPDEIDSNDIIDARWSAGVIY